MPNQFPPVTEAQVAQWREFMADPSHSYNQAAAKFGVSRRTIAKYATVDPKPPKYSPEDIANWEAALNEGYGYKHVAEMYGVAEKTVSSHLPGRGWTNEQVREHAALMRSNKARVLS